MDRPNGRLVSAGELVDVAAEVLAGAGAPSDNALAVARSLVRSNLVGHDSHGVRRLSSYVEAVRDGQVDPAARPYVQPRRGATVVVEGRRAFGQLAAQRAVAEVRSAAVEHGVASAAIRECNHAGRLGEYVADLAEHDLVALALCNADPTVAPFGGRERRTGTNPMAWAVPRAPGSAPVVMDWATSATAEGKLAVAQAGNQRIPPGQLVDAQGRESTEPGDFYRGGALLPFGGHKGSGLNMIIEMIGGLLSGAGIGSLPGYDGSFGTVVLALDITSFLSTEHFREQVELFCSELAGTPTAAGHREVLVPGEPEERTRRQRAAHGVPVPDGTWRELHELLPGPGTGP